jgi:NTE family protein
MKIHLLQRPGPVASLSLFVLMLGWAAPYAQGCDFEDDDGPDVGLVLSGGGALASTQIGTLLLLKELGVPIHCVSGTSMGAIVGALYAAGYEPQQIRDIFAEAPWGELFSPPKRRRDSGFLEKEREDQYFSDYVAGIRDDGSVQLPGGVASMTGLKTFYRDLLFNIPLQSDFDDMRVPYRAVATDISTGKARVFADGDIVEAMLASMALPAVFAPREVDGRTYLDGGLSQNLPVQTALDMGADIIIAVDNTLEPPQIDSSASFADVTQQLGRLLVWQNYQRQAALLDDDDVLIRPDPTGFNITEFNRVDDGVARGQAATREHLERLREIARTARAAPTRPAPAQPELDTTLVMINDTIVDDERVAARLNYDPSDLDNPERLERKLRDITSFGGFGEVDLSQNGLSPVLSINERPLGRTLVSLGLRGQTNLDGDSNFGLLARVSRRPFSNRGGEFSLSGEFGTNLGATAELYQPFGSVGRFFVQPSAAIRANELLFDIDDFRVGEFWQQSGVLQVRVGRELGDWGVISVDTLATTGRIRPQVTVAPDVFMTESYNLAGVGARFGVDTLDRNNWPRAGTRLIASAQHLESLDVDAQNNKYRLALLQAATLGTFGVNLRVRSESIRSEDDTPIEILALGGFRQLSAYSLNSLPTNQYTLASVEVFRPLSAPGEMFALPLYAGATLEYANVKFDLFSQGAQENLGSVGLYLGADTPVGPMQFGAGFSDEGRYSFFLNLGTTF